MRCFRVIGLAMICLSLCVSVSAAEANDAMLAPVLEEMYVSAIISRDVHPGIHPSYAPLPPIDEAKACLDACAVLLYSFQKNESTISVYQGERDFLLFFMPDDSAGWTLHYVNNIDHNAINPYLITCISQYPLYQSTVECWVNKLEYLVPKGIPFRYAVTHDLYQQETVYEYVFCDGFIYSIFTDPAGQIIGIEITINDLIRELFDQMAS